MTLSLRSIALVWLLCLPVVVAAQPKNFRVMSCGPGVQANSGAGWKAIMVGVDLPPTASLKIPQNSYVALVYDNSATVELSQPGTFALAEYKSNKQPSSLTERYLKFIAEQTTSQAEGQMDIPGGVERAVAPSPIMPAGGYVLNDLQSFTWHSQKGAKGYVFEILDPDGAVIHTETLQDTFVTINLQPLMKETGECYYWRVGADGPMAGVKSNPQCFMAMGEKRGQTLAEIEALQNDLGTPASAANQVVMAQFYAENKLYAEANAAYQRALEKAPNVEIYRRLYARFLVQRGLNNDAKAVLEAE